MLIDSHCHFFTSGNGGKAGEQIIADANKAGVTKLITIGTSVFYNKRAIKAAKTYDNVYCAVGIYPHDDLAKSIEDLKKTLVASITSCDKVVGIGECGFDVTNWQGGRSINDQSNLFEMQIQLALEQSLPIIIHNRDGDDLLFKLLEKYKDSGLHGVAHSFSQDWSVAKKYLDLGFYLSFSGMITYPARKPLLEIVKNVPMDRFLVETDSPYLPPQGHRGEKNYPEYVKIVAEKVSQVKEKPFDEIAAASYKNTCDLFRL